MNQSLDDFEDICDKLDEKDVAYLVAIAFPGTDVSRVWNNIGGCGPAAPRIIRHAVLTSLKKYESNEPRPIDTAPRDGTPIFGIYEDDPSKNSPVVWSTDRKCMWCSPGNNCGEGWATCSLSRTDENLPVDPPTHWIGFNF